MQSILLKNALILPCSDMSANPFIGNILIQNKKITSIFQAFENFEIPLHCDIIDCTGKLVTPGLINAHAHSSEMLFKGKTENLPLELWLLYAYPVIESTPVSDRLLYLRTLLVAMESIRSGVTMLSDDFFEVPNHDLKRLAIVFKAYHDIGIRANISSAVINLQITDTLPFASQLLPTNVINLLSGPVISAQSYLDFCHDVFSTLHQSDGRLRFMLAPSAPQRCDVDTLMALKSLSDEKKVPLHTHVLETRVQAVTGNIKFGQSLIEYMHELDLLSPLTTIAHAVWVSDHDINLMGQAGCSVAHNAISNQKLGAGLAPIRKMLDNGVNVALGTDGACSNDSLRLFDVIRMAALAQGLSSPNPDMWLNAAEVLNMATMGGARAAGLSDKVGSIEIGKSADLNIFNLNTLPFTPLNDVSKQLVYCENGSSLAMVMIDGDFVYKHNKLLKINEEDIMLELSSLLPHYLFGHSLTERANHTLEPFFRKIYDRCMAEPISFQRHVQSI